MAKCPAAGSWGDGMKVIPAFAAVDWGMTTFRLWLMSREGAVAGEARSGEGLLAIGRDGFAPTLERHLAELGATENLPVIISGSAGARQGWIEAGYLTTPAPVGNLADHAMRVPDAARPVIILPGIATMSPDGPDVMRGEETQLFGALLEVHGEGRYCLPGTHSKWVVMEGMTLRNFQSYMTGELFALLAERSILSHSVSAHAPVQGNDPAFVNGVRDGWANPARISHLLFSIRAAHLLHHRPAAESRARLSGLLIGAEIAGAGIAGGEEVALVSSGTLGQLYQAALTVCGAKVRPIDSEIAVQRGLFEAWRMLEGELTAPS
jgi:2-keto-3-deoxy-galactonokinase